MMNWLASENLPYFLQAAALLCLVSALVVFVFFVALPIHRLVLKLAEYASAHGGGLPGKRFKNDAEVLEAVFKLLTEDLQAKEAELQRLYEQARDRARFMERYNDRVVESVPVAVLGFDAQGDVAGLNSQAEALLRCRQPQVLGLKADRLLAAENPLRPVLARVLEQGKVVLPTDVIWEEGGEHRYLELSGAPLPSGEGFPGGYVVTLADRTSFRKLEEQVRVNERLASLVDLSTGLAHQIRNPLGGILGYVDLLLKRPGLDPESLEMARTIQDEGKQLQRVVDEFVEFLRRREVSEKPLRWSDLQDDLRNDLDRTLQERGATLRFRVEESEPWVRLDRVSAYQALSNLALNAVEASPRGGVVEIRSFRSGTGEAVLTVEDAGPGIPDSIRANIFHPFFTTKPQGKGLGLSIVRRITQAAKGRLEFGASPSGGTQMTLSLPTQAAGPSPFDPDPPAPGDPS